MENVRLTGDISEFVLGGNSTFTLRSTSTGRRYTYNIKRSKDCEQLYFVHLLRGADNENDYSYIGCYYEDTQVFHPCKTWRYEHYDKWPGSMKAILYMFNKLYNIPAALQVYHVGKCCRCGRKLTTPGSILAGIGPECRRLNND